MSKIKDQRSKIVITLNLPALSLPNGIQHPFEWIPGQARDDVE